jgi:hypothetical protein
MKVKNRSENVVDVRIESIESALKYLGNIKVPEGSKARVEYTAKTNCKKCFGTGKFGIMLDNNNEVCWCDCLRRGAIQTIPPEVKSDTVPNADGSIDLPDIKTEAELNKEGFSAKI